MRSDSLRIISELYGNDESSKLIVADEHLNIIYTNKPLLFSELTPDMFSRSNTIPVSEGIFPISSKQVLSLTADGISYIASVRPFNEGGKLFYIIEVLDSYDFSKLEQLSQSAISEQNRLSKLREASSSIYAAQLLMAEQALREDFECPQAMEMFDKSCYMILSAIANRTELQYYAQDVIDKRPMNISAVTEELCAICSVYLRKKGIELTAEIEKDIVAVFDFDRYTAAILNLTVNAAMYNISETKKIELSLREANSEVRITVKDNGIGMSLDDVEKAFIPYALCSRSGGSSGLGLPTVELFAKACGGSASIVSKPNNGTSVTIRLPACNASNNEVQAPPNIYIGDKFSPVSIYLSQIKLPE